MVSPQKDMKEHFELRSYSSVVPRALFIGSSTGGPQALAHLLEDIAPNALKRVPIFITQHMPGTFTKLLAAKLGKVSGIPCHEGEHLEMVQNGRIYVAPGGKHMTLKRDGTDIRIFLDEGPEVNFCRPAVDPMVMSGVEIYKSATLFVLLTGMGTDGMHAAGKITERGGSVIAQDEESSVVWGMPGAAAQMGYCSEVMPLKNIGRKVTYLLNAGA